MVTNTLIATMARDIGVVTSNEPATGGIEPWCPGPAFGHFPKELGLLAKIGNLVRKKSMISVEVTNK